MGSNEQENEDKQSIGDPRRLVLPYVSTGIRIYKNKTTRELGIYLPAAVVISIAVLAVLSGSIGTAALLGMAAVPLLIAGLALDVRMSRAWYYTPEGIIKEFLSYRRLERSLPWGHNETVEDTHNIRSIQADGSVKRQDGSQASLIRVHGMNTTHLSASEIDLLVKDYTSEIEGELSSEDHWWATYSTTRPASTKKIINQRVERGTEIESELNEEQRKLMRQSAKWHNQRDKAFNANDWRHYIVVEATLDEAAADPNSISERVSRTQSMLPSFIPFIGPNENNSSEDEDTENDQDDEAETSDDRVGELLTKRVNKIKSAIGGVGELETERASPGEHIEVLRSYWTDQNRETSDDDPKLLNLFERDWDVDGHTPTERMLSADEYDIDGRTVKLDDSYLRTFWVSHWPLNPNQLFLDDLHTTRNVDLDVKTHVTPINKEDADEIIKDQALDVDAEGIDRAKDDEISALPLNSKSDAYKKGFLLSSDGAQAWHINGYITVRAGTKKKLKEYSEAIERVMKSNNCTVTAPSKSQHECFRSAGPLSADIYNQKASPQRERIAFSGTLGAMFPFAAADLNEDDGMYWGRNAQTKEAIIADPFSRGTAPHIITIGMSRSGKTYFAKEALAGWFLEADDRTLIVADTQSGFHDLCNVCDGEHIAIDSKQEINPLHIEPPSQERIEQTDGKLDPLTQKINQVAQILLSIASEGEATGTAAGTNAGNIYKLLRYVIRQTYKKAGIEHDDLSTHANPSPTLDDFVDELENIRNNAEQATLIGSDGEVDGRVDDIDNLAQSLMGLIQNDDGQLGDGGFSHLRGEGTIRLLDSDVRMAYLDLNHLDGSDAAEKSIGLQIALSQIAQKIKRAPGQTIFMIDEAHLLYQSERLVDWLQRAAREWARYEACMWSVSQSPEEFVQQIDSNDNKTENKRQVIREQCSTLQVFYSNKTNPDTLDKFGLGSESIHIAKSSLTPGRATKDTKNPYSECLIQFNGEEGWIRSRVEGMPLCQNEAEEDNKKSTDVGEAGEVVPTMSADVSTLDRVEESDARKLNEVDIESVEGLLNAGAKEILSVSEASAQEVDSWLNEAMELSRKQNNSNDKKTIGGEEVSKATPTLTAEVSTIDGVGDTYSGRLNEVGIETVEDILDAGTEEVASISEASPQQVDSWLSEAVELSREQNSNSDKEPTSVDDPDEAIPATDGGK